MQRDWDLIQEILEAYKQDNPLDEETVAIKEIVQSRDRGEEMDEFIYHHSMLEKAGYIGSMENTLAEDHTQRRPAFLTMKGHNLLEDLQNDDLPEAPRSRQY